MFLDVTLFIQSAGGAVVGSQHHSYYCTFLDWEQGSEGQGCKVFMYSVVLSKINAMCNVKKHFEV